MKLGGMNNTERKVTQVTRLAAMKLGGMNNTEKGHTGHKASSDEAGRHERLMPRQRKVTQVTTKHFNKREEADFVVI